MKFKMFYKEIYIYIVDYYLIIIFLNIILILEKKKKEIYIYINDISVNVIN